ncbi:MAG: hypothetical protein KFB93_03485 [Simkaniaceae bacterium]|nr:MAG: hypothetical protein KFB93_03485 [Simkaniaceae bacterium]
MSNPLQYIYPQPITDIAVNMHKAAKADNYKLDNENFRTAVKVVAYSFSRIALAGAIYYGMNKYKTDALRTTVAGVLISTPATILFWSGKLLVTGAKALHANYRTPFTRAFATGAFQTLGALALSGCYKDIGFRAGLVEWQVFPRVFGKLEVDGRVF